MLYTVSVWNSYVEYKAANVPGRHFTCTDMKDAYISGPNITVFTDFNILALP